MKLALKLMMVGLVILSSFALESGSVQADSPGPYYATPSWDQTLPSATRFTVLSNFASAAVLDRETGLVWEKSPSPDAQSWADARSACINKNVGGRRGWRLPSIQELTSLIDPSAQFPALPVGHPFANISLFAYWSASTDPDAPVVAWLVSLGSGVADTGGKATSNHTWCVRGGGPLDNY